MDLSVQKIRCDTLTSAEGTTLRISAFVTDDRGLYVLLPLTREGFTPEQIRLLAAHLDNAFATIAWMFDHPDEAATSGAITAEDAARIQTFRMAAGTAGDVA